MTPLIFSNKHTPPPEVNVVLESPKVIISSPRVKSHRHRIPMSMHSINLHLLEQKLQKSSSMKYLHNQVRVIQQQIHAGREHWRILPLTRFHLGDSFSRSLSHERISPQKPLSPTRTATAKKELKTLICVKGETLQRVKHLKSLFR
jgi:hypothetical protein